MLALSGAKIRTMALNNTGKAKSRDLADELLTGLA